MAVELLPGMPTEEEIRVAMSLESTRPHFAPWALGRGYTTLQNKGYRQSEIAKAVGKSQSHVSRCVTVYQGLSPGAHDILCRLSPPPGIHVVVEASTLLDELTGGPDQERQLAYLERVLGPERVRAGSLRPERFAEVLGMTLPGHVSPFVVPVLRYCSGELDTLTFPEAPCPTTAIHEAPRRGNSPTRSTGSTRRKPSSGS